MAKQKVTIEVDVPDGYEPTGEYRCPEGHEAYLTDSGKLQYANVRFECIKCIILRKQFEWPAWLKAAAIARDQDGVVWAYRSAPRANAHGWISNGGDVMRIKPEFIDLNLPDVRVWVISFKRIKP